MNTTSTPIPDADPALADRVRHALGKYNPVGPLTQLEGGHSGLTYIMATGTDRHVVKAVPPGRRAVGRNDVLRQAILLRALASTDLPIPTVTAWEELAPAWFAMRYAEGEAVEPVLDTRADGTTVPAEIARQRMRAAARVLGQLHAVSKEELTERLAAVGMVAPEPNDPSAELDRWSRTMHAVPEQLRPGSGDLLAALSRDVPAATEPVLLHGDFRLGNLLCREVEPNALVDWEIWGLGDPRVDLGWFGTFTEPALFPGVGRVVQGLPDETELLETYRTARGDARDVETELTWFRALGRMKMAAIMGHNLRRHREGTHHDPEQEQLPETIAALIASASKLLTQP